MSLLDKLDETEEFIDKQLKELDGPTQADFIEELIVFLEGRKNA